VSEFRQVLTFLGVLQVLGSAGLFAFLLAVLRFPSASLELPRKWHVFRKRTKLQALCASEDDPSTWSGFFFAAFFYYALPFWWWQWGLRKTLYLIAIPVVAAVLLKIAFASLLSTQEDPLDDSMGMIVTSVTLILLRVIAGLYVRKHHRRLRRAALEDRGWVLCGTVNASSASAATKSFAGPSKFRRLVSSARKAFNVK